MPSVGFVSTKNTSTNDASTKSTDPGDTQLDGPRLSDSDETKPAQQVAAESGAAHTLGHGTSGGDDYTAINPGGTSVDEASGAGERNQANP